MAAPTRSEVAPGWLSWKSLFRSSAIRRPAFRWLLLTALQQRQEFGLSIQEAYSGALPRSSRVLLTRTEIISLAVMPYNRVALSLRKVAHCASRRVISFQNCESWVRYERKIT
jgi:hypothetical protein